MKKHISLLIAAVLGVSAAIPAAGCSSKSSSSDTSVPETSAPASTASTTAPPETTTTTTTTAPLMPPMSKPAETLDGFNEAGEAARIQCGYDNTVVFRSTNYTDYSSYVYVFDPITNKTVRTLKLGISTEDFLGTFSDGTIVTYSYSDKVALHYYPEDSDVCETIDLGIDIVPELHLDMKNDCIYYLNRSSNGIIKLDRDGKSTELFTDMDLNYINSIDTDTMTFCANVFNDYTEDNNSPCICSLEDGSILAEFSDSSSYSHLTKSSCLNIVNDFSGDTAKYFLEIYDLSDKKLRQTYLLSSDSTYSFEIDSSDDSDYALLTTWHSNMDGSLAKLSFIDATTGKITAPLDGLQYNTAQLSACYCKELRRWIAAVNEYEGSTSHTHLVMLDPTLMHFSSDLAVTEREKKEYIPFVCGEEYSSVRKYADEIEKDFGVTILVGDEVKNAENGADYKFITTESSESFASPDDVMFSLKGLRYQLSLFPDGFFSHFRSSKGKYGLRISLVSELTSDYYSEFTAGGVAYKTGPWYNIAIQSTMVGYSDTAFYHELWHSTEQLLTDRYGFNEEEWSKLNPHGFSYTNDFESYMTSNDTLYTKLFEIEYSEPKDYDAPYFISNYSIITPMEDRATLIEYLFGWRFDENREYQFGTENMNKYPHMKAKLDYLAEYSKQEFGYVYWEKVLKNAVGTYKTFEW